MSNPLVDQIQAVIVSMENEVVKLQAAIKTLRAVLEAPSEPSSTNPPTIGRPRTVTDEQRALALRLRGDGHTHRRIAKATGHARVDSRQHSERSQQVVDVVPPMTHDTFQRNATGGGSC